MPGIDERKIKVLNVMTYVDGRKKREKRNLKYQTNFF